uniref:BTB domain-containing protein n=1 Tax=Anopheles atroparvus TaxID=41427 RepID=A0A182JMU1_ANOAO
MAAQEAYGFVGTWEILESHLDGTGEKLGLEGIKFRLDEMGDIIWYNDLINTNNSRNGGGQQHRWGAALDGTTFCPISDSAAVLFSCETFEIVELSSNGPGLIFGAYTGHSIEFRTNLYNPGERMSLRCDGWCELHCQRVNDDQSVGQEEPFTLISVLDDGNFCDVTLKSCDNVIYNVHSPILRLNGFDCSSMTAASTYQHLASRFECAEQAQTLAAAHPPLMKMSSVPCARTARNTSTAPALTSVSARASVLGLAPTVSVSASAAPSVGSMTILNPNFLLPPTLDAYSLSPKQLTHISNSFNCLAGMGASGSSDAAGGSSGSIFLDVPRRAPGLQQASCSDSNLNVDRNVFYFPDAVPVCRGVKFRQPPPPASPFRARSPSPFPIASLETPPSSPLTPLSVLGNIPSKLLATILHWLYCECLPEHLDEDSCIQLINMCESTTPLSRMIEPCKNYLRNIQLKKFVIDIINDLHDSLNHLIQTVNPGTISHSPCVLCQVFKEGVKECLTAIVKLLQFCNIFTKDATTFTRQQRHEIIKYVRTRMPIYLSQVHQLLQNVNLVLGSLTQEDRNDLVSYLVPEITGALEVLTASVSEIKRSLEKVCKDLKSTQQQQQQQQQQQLPLADCRPPSSGRNTGGGSGGRSGQQGNRSASERTASNRARTRSAAEQPRLGQSSSESDLKFFLYMYEVKKMRDIYGRVTSTLEVLLHKKSTFNEMNLMDQHQTVRRNLEQLAVEVPAAIGQLEELCDTIDEKIGWKEFKFCFKFLTSQVNGIVSKLLEHKNALNDAMLYISNLVQKEQFTGALVELGVLDKRSVDPAVLHECAKRRCAVRSSGQRQLEYATVKVNLVQKMCESPTASHSSLSKNALKLLHSGHLADMEFEVIVSLADRQNENVPGTFDFSPDDSLMLNGAGGQAGCSRTTTVAANSPGDELILASDILVASTASGPVEMEVGSGSTRSTGIAKDSQSHCFKAHRVIVAARCDWFKKALISGMQEDINRKIIVYDTSPVIFRRLLLYLYGAPVDKSVGVDQLCELMLLADRYSVDNLKAICEETLVASIDSESVICLFGISDRFNASTLKARCLSYLSQHNELTQLDIFQELPLYLQNEVQELVRWCGRVPEPWCDRLERSRSERTRHCLKSPSKSSRSSRSRKSSPSFM